MNHALQKGTKGHTNRIKIFRDDDINNIKNYFKINDIQSFEMNVSYMCEVNLRWVLRLAQRNLFCCILLENLTIPLYASANTVGTGSVFQIDTKQNALLLSASNSVHTYKLDSNFVDKENALDAMDQVVSPTE